MWCIEIDFLKKKKMKERKTDADGIEEKKRRKKSTRTDRWLVSRSNMLLCY
jgi:hypothetical protein